jgi:hypothetical protein
VTRPLRDDGPTYDAALAAEVVDVPLPDEDCVRCGELVNLDAPCEHGRQLCPECLHACPACRFEEAKWL